MSVEPIDERLARLRGELEAYEGDEIEPMSPDWFAHQSLLQRQVQLFQEREIEAGDHDFEVSLSHGAVIGNTVATKFAGQFLTSLQDALYSAGQVLISEPKRKGQFGDEVVDRTQLRLVATHAGSFVLGLQGPRRHMQTSIDGEADVPVLDEAIEMVMDVLEASSDEVTADRLLEAAGTVGARGVTHLRTLAGNLSGTGTVARFTHRPPLGEEPRSVLFTSPAARRLEQVLSRTEQTTETVAHRGRLVGASWVNKRFELQVGEGPDAEILRGSVTVDLRGLVADSFDQEVEAMLEKTTTRSDVEGAEKVTYRLVDLTPSANPGRSDGGQTG